MADPAPAIPVRAWAPWFLPALATALIADLATKVWAFSLPWYAPGRDEVFAIAQAYNKGVAWSMGSSTPWLVAALTFVLIPVLGLVWWFSYRGAGRAANLAFGMVLGGALGNAWDRLLASAGHSGILGVRDFIHVNLHVPFFDPWPTFNIADSAICVGFALLLIATWRRPAAPAASPA